MQGRSDAEPDNRAAEMRIVADVAAVVRFHAEERGQNEKDSIQPGGQGERQVEKRDTGAGKQKRIGKNHPANTAGSAISTVVMVAMNEKRKQAATDNGPEIDEQELE